MVNWKSSSCSTAFRTEFVLYINLMGEILIEYIARDNALRNAATCESLLWSFQLFTNFSPTVSLLQGHLINAIAWNKSKLTESSTQTILLGTTKGLLFAKNTLLWIWVEVHIAQLKPSYSFTRKQVTPLTLTTYCSFIPSFLPYLFTLLLSLKGLIFQTEVEPEEKFFQGGLEKFWKQVRCF